MNYFILRYLNKLTISRCLWHKYICKIAGSYETPRRVSQTDGGWDGYGGGARERDGEGAGRPGGPGAVLGPGAGVSGC